MWQVGQRVISRTEPELGLGLVAGLAGVDMVDVVFPRTAERRTYKGKSAPIRRVTLEGGQEIRVGKDVFMIASRDTGPTGLFVYRCDDGHDVIEEAIDELISDQGVLSQFLAGQWTHHQTYELRREAWSLRSRSEQGKVRGLVGPRVRPLPHQLYIAHEVAHRERPRVLLADEVGLGKTIEAGLIFSSLRALGRAERVLIVVPQALQHQWLTEMFRRFNHLFTILSDERFAEEDGKTFRDNHLIIASLDLLLSDESYFERLLAESWDLVIIDEAHHLTWDPDEPTAEWILAKKLSESCRALLLLTATPRLSGLETQFGLMNLVDAARFSSWDVFLAETKALGAVAKIAKDIQEQGVTAALRQELTTMFPDDVDLADETNDQAKVLSLLVDRHGTGRMLFRNRRALLQGFPKRTLHSVPLEATQRYRRELASQEFNPDTFFDIVCGSMTEATATLLADSPKLVWLKDFLQGHNHDKVFVMASSSEQVMQIAEYLAGHKIRLAMFHEGMSIIERDRQAASFAEPNGAKVLISSEIGGEGRNFQAARTMVLMDLPFEPDLLEQRIGRLDRIGQGNEIHIFVPWLRDTPEEVLFGWYQHGLLAFTESWSNASLLLETHGKELMRVARAFLPHDRDHALRKRLLEDLEERARAAAQDLRAKNQESIDILLDINSHNPDVGASLQEAVVDFDDDPALELFMRAMFEHYGVDFEDYDDRGSLLVNGDALMFIEQFPGLSGEHASIFTFDRDIALAREDLTFLTFDHPIADGALSLLLERNEGSCCVCAWPDSGLGRGIIVEMSVILAPQGPRDLELARFLPIKAKEYVLDHRGQSLRSRRHKEEPFHLVAVARDDVPFTRDNLETFIKPLIEKAQAEANQWARREINQALAKALPVLDEEIQRLKHLARLNSSVRDADVERAEARKASILRYLGEAQPRIDGVRLILTN